MSAGRRGIDASSNPVCWQMPAYVHLLAADVQDWFSELRAATDSKGQFSIKGCLPVATTSAGTYEREHTTLTGRSKLASHLDQSYQAKSTERVMGADGGPETEVAW